MACAHVSYSTREEPAPGGGVFLVVYCTSCGAELSRSWMNR